MEGNIFDEATTWSSVTFLVSQCVHSLRHTFATWMLMQTGNIRLVSALLGHTSLEQTQGYAHVALLAMRAMQPEEFLEVGVSWRQWIESGGEAAPLSVLGTAGLAHEGPSAW